MQRLQEIREKKGITRTDLAKIMNVGTNTICRWEKGQRSPDLGTIRRLAICLDCSITDLISESNPTAAAEAGQ